MTDTAAQNGSGLAGSGHPCRAVLVPRSKTTKKKVCGKEDKDKPMCFRGEIWCCDQHRKLVEAQRAQGNETIVGLV